MKKLMMVLVLFMVVIGCTENKCKCVYEIYQSGKVINLVSISDDYRCDDGVNFDNGKSTAFGYENPTLYYKLKSQKCEVK